MHLHGWCHDRPTPQCASCGWWWPQGSETLPCALPCPSSRFSRCRWSERLFRGWAMQCYTLSNAIPLMHLATCPPNAPACTILLYTHCYNPSHTQRHTPEAMKGFAPYVSPSKDELAGREVVPSVLHSHHRGDTQSCIVATQCMALSTLTSLSGHCHPHMLSCAHSLHCRPRCVCHVACLD